MERGYLIAALALIITFTAMSHGARSLARASRACIRHHVLILQPNFDGDSGPAFRAEAMKAQLRNHIPDEPALLAQLNIPEIQAQAQIAQQVVEQQQEMAQRLSEEMARNSEEMSRNAQQLSRNMTEHLARQNLAIARCARIHAMQQAERTLKNLQVSNVGFQ
jgi:hypothetical protein